MCVCVCACVRVCVRLTLIVDNLLIPQVDDGRSFQAKCRFDTDVELMYFHHGGILNYTIRQMIE